MEKINKLFIMCKFNTADATELQSILFKYGVIWRDSDTEIIRFDDREGKYIRFKIILPTMIMAYGTHADNDDVSYFINNGSYLDKLGTYYVYRYGEENIKRLGFILTHKSDMVATYLPRKINKTI